VGAWPTLWDARSTGRAGNRGPSETRSVWSLPSATHGRLPQRARVVAWSRRGADPPPRPSRRDRNDEALVLRIEYGLASFLLASDIESAREQALVVARAPLTATVLKVAHHGSRTSSTPAFLGAVGPTIAVISV